MLPQRLKVPVSAAPGHAAVVGYDLEFLIEGDTPILRGTLHLALPGDEDTIVLRAVIQHQDGAMETNDETDWLVSAGVSEIEVEWWLDHPGLITDLRFAVGITDKVELVPGTSHGSVTVHDVRFFLSPPQHGSRRLDLLGDIENAGSTVETCNLVVEYLAADGSVLDDGFAIGDALPPGRTTLSFLGTWDADQQAKHGTPAGVRIKHVELENTRWWSSALAPSHDLPPPPPPQPGYTTGQSPAGVDLSLGGLPNRPDDLDLPADLARELEQLGLDPNAELGEIEAMMKKLQDR